MAELPPPLDGQKDLEQVGKLLGVSRGSSESDDKFRARLDLLWVRRKHEVAGHPKEDPPQKL